MKPKIRSVATLDKHVFDKPAGGRAIRQPEPVTLRIQDQYGPFVAGENAAGARRQTAIKNTRLFQLVLEHLNERPRTMDRTARTGADQQMKIIVRRCVPARFPKAGTYLLHGCCGLWVRKCCGCELGQLNRISCQIRTKFNCRICILTAGPPVCDDTGQPLHQAFGEGYAQRLHANGPKPLCAEGHEHIGQAWPGAFQPDQTHRTICTCFAGRFQAVKSAVAE
ncbi:hypothetical protein E2K80_11480 [Rhodophyticola sp. CCM32]|uniref:hypothetical protein n=1 Tax=Rhodophyticola sp. CCM32 TaxID=2916397 RepID=UPI00107F1398|nr:hypothetical protein [Rhodophyticola sp. CCM32]QBY01269.1 hypothetical protein E2K80_11480 [Rhodophyticola sp. CCM32]